MATRPRRTRPPLHMHRIRVGARRRRSNPKKTKMPGRGAAGQVSRFSTLFNVAAIAANDHEPFDCGAEDNPASVSRQASRRGWSTGCQWRPSATGSLRAFTDERRIRIPQGFLAAMPILVSAWWVVEKRCGAEARERLDGRVRTSFAFHMGGEECGFMNGSSPERRACVDGVLRHVVRKRARCRRDVPPAALRRRLFDIRSSPRYEASRYPKSAACDECASTRSLN
jgi:hypothetical protein